MAAVMHWQATAAAPTGLSEEQAAYRDAARDFALAQLGPHAAHWDAQCKQKTKKVKLRKI